MIGAWGSAVKNPGSLLQLRALDWNTDGKCCVSVFFSRVYNNMFAYLLTIILGTMSTL